MSMHQWIRFQVTLQYRTIDIRRDGGYCEGKIEKVQRQIRFNCDNILIDGEKIIDLAAAIYVFASNGNGRREVLSESLNKRMDMAGHQKMGASGEMYFYPPDAIICHLPVPETDFFQLLNYLIQEESK